MSQRRSSRGKPTKEKDKDHKEKCNGISKKDQDQWIILVNDEALKLNNSENPVFCKLRHPKTEKSALFLFSTKDKDIYELQMFNEPCRSWLIDNSVHKDGKMLFTSPIDPLFLVLPYLQKAEKTGKYMTLDQILTDDDYQECSRLSSTSGMSELQEVSDIKGDDSFKAYRFNKEKTLSWLKRKTDRLADKILEKNISVSSSHSANFVKSKKSSVTSREDYVRFSHGMISDYLSEELSIALREHMGIPLVAPKKDIENEEPPAKRQKTDKLSPTDDYSSQKSKIKAQEETKLSTAQKKLSQVDKTGMKSISSFFSAKQKS